MKVFDINNKNLILYYKNKNIIYIKEDNILYKQLQISTALAPQENQSN